MAAAEPERKLKPQEYDECAITTKQYINYVNRQPSITEVERAVLGEWQNRVDLGLPVFLIKGESQSFSVVPNDSYFSLIPILNFSTSWKSFFWDEEEDFKKVNNLFFVGITSLLTTTPYLIPEMFTAKIKMALLTAGAVHMTNVKQQTRGVFLGEGDIRGRKQRVFEIWNEYRNTEKPTTNEKEWF